MRALCSGSMNTRLSRPVALGLALLLGACSGVASLEEEQAPLEPAELAKVESKSEEAFRKGLGGTAWDEAVRAGAPRERLEAIALEAMAPSDPVERPASPGTGADMFAELRGKYGRLSPASRAKVRERRAQYAAGNRWTDALELELAAADDPPIFTGAWEVYDEAPAWKSTSIRERIQEAKEDYAAEQAERAAGSDG